MQWTDRIRQVKIILVAVAVLIAVASLLVSRLLVHDLLDEERAKMQVWADAMHAINAAGPDDDMSLAFSVISSNSTIPVVVMSSSGDVCDYSNIDISGSDTLAFLSDFGRRMQQSGNSVRIAYGDSADYELVCYDESIMLKRLSAWPYVQLGIVLIFVVVAIFALLSSKRAEQNKVWVGLSKETAHQLGTPISSLMAWTEMLRETYPDDGMIPEMSQDVRRLELIADRFSKIGSLPEPVASSMNEVLDHVITYMGRRTSNKVQIVRHFPDREVIVRMNASLFEWVIENLCKNAVDAMEGTGTITLTLLDEGSQAVISFTHKTTPLN